MKFHFNKPGNKELDGPYNLEDAQKLLAEGKYTGTDNVWNAEKKNWQTVAELPMLAKFSSAKPRHLQAKASKIEKTVFTQRDTKTNCFQPKAHQAPKNLVSEKKFYQGRTGLKKPD